ncbi:oral-facial-digital syndrome 1 protein [Sphaerodactylus townsendi]|nr:oral-facial-digital syndrome 1 protein [Sphaerodactylus townsendi]XP_048348634.1 oral-facial-digital syndrome 1 protein [Sphaerodactylus townsendi]XP_048348635.1 oral-facial-digital syndrome 1 protein [Sphaerodactylus townsendi]XP_048348636.1 oral-facial-digital syndrome 1 protein [Sphaerodactylus townsendi]XP_048348637.1 oral-facial-digital syndrome 1 protein [Sphaerodactylus townsendi]
MSSPEFKVLSQDELRKRLYQTFKNRGVLDTLKTQLRNQLIHELMNPVLSGKIQLQTVSNDCSSLLISASNSLVADHLHRCGYEYSLSVFYPESGLEKDKLLTMQDLLHLMRINPKTDLYKTLISASQKDNAKGFLVQVLMELIEHNLCKETCDTGTQTGPTPCYKESLAEKLQLIDEQFADKYPHRNTFESLEVKLIEYRKEIEDQLQAEMAQKLHHFKEVEIAKIQMDERAQSQKEISELRREFEKAHQAKSEALTSRERNAISRLQKQQEIDAREIYVQRQSLLKDIETIRSREAELKQRMEAFDLAQKLQESKNKTMEDALRCREVAVKTIEETYDQKLKSELLQYQLELKEEYIARTKKITEEEKKNKERATLLQDEAMSVESKKEEFKQAVSRAKELERQLDSVKAQDLLLSKQNQLLTEKLKEVSDYPLLKEEKMELQVQIKILQQQLEEARSDNIQLRDKLTQPSSEYTVLQAELKRIEQARKLEHDESETHKQFLEKQLRNEVDNCLQLKAQLSECENTIKKLNTQVEDLKLQLKQTQTALQNEVYRNPKLSLVNRSVIDFTGDKTVPRDIYMEGAFLTSVPVTGDIGMGNAANLKPCHTLKPTTSPDSDLEFVADTKTRIQELEREAEYLEEAYRNYQHRVIQSCVGPAKIQSSSPLSKNFSVSSGRRHWLAQDNLPAQDFALSYPKSKKYNWTPRNDYQLENHPISPQKKAVSSRRLSSTPVSKTKRNIRSRLFSEDIPGSYLEASHQCADKPLSPIIRTDNPSPDSVCITSAASSPVLHEQKMSLHNQGDSAKPMKLMYEDLGSQESANEYQEDIPEQLESNVSHPSGRIVSGSQGPVSVLPTVTSQQDTSGAELTALGTQRQPEEQQEEEDKWEEERRRREARRSLERQEALEREQAELEKLNEEMNMQESVTTKERTQDENADELEVSLQKAEDHGGDAVPNPLEKYMKMVQQNQEQEIANKTSKKEDVDISSERLPGSEREDSFSAAGSLQGEPDEDFW